VQPLSIYWRRAFREPERPGSLIRQHQRLRSFAGQARADIGLTYKSVNFASQGPSQGCPRYWILSKFSRFRDSAQSPVLGSAEREGCALRSMLLQRYRPRPTQLPGSPLGVPLIPNWNRLIAAIPDFFSLLNTAVESDTLDVLVETRCRLNRYFHRSRWYANSSRGPLFCAGEVSIAAASAEKHSHHSFVPRLRTKCTRRCGRAD
jgi:hypothetical protein